MRKQQLRLSLRFNLVLIYIEILSSVDANRERNISLSIMNANNESSTCSKAQTKLDGEGCPFGSAYGYSTKQGRQEYLDFSHKETSSSTGDDELRHPSKSLEADTDVFKQLYFWQLHSLIGREPILDICRDFYDFVYLDFEEPWFREVFEEVASKEHHILTQAAYWIDAMGGGRL